MVRSLSRFLSQIGGDAHDSEYAAEISNLTIQHSGGSMSKKTVTLDLSRSIYRQLEREADREDVDLEQCAIDIIQDYFESEENPPDQK